jgi:hypothetical protein
MSERTPTPEPSPAQRVVDEQAEDEGLWFIAETATEAYLQQELRRLHAAIEAPEPSPEGELAKFVAIIFEYAEHQSWRCTEPLRYPWKKNGTDCECGLTKDLREVGLAYLETGEDG